MNAQRKLPELLLTRFRGMLWKSKIGSQLVAQVATIQKILFSCCDNLIMLISVLFDHPWTSQSTIQHNTKQKKLEKYSLLIGGIF
jgi:hypothetical protein